MNQAVVFAVLLMTLADGQASIPSQGKVEDPQRRCNSQFGDYSDFAQTRDFPYVVTKERRNYLLRSCGQLAIGVKEDRLLQLMGTPDYIEPEDLNDVRIGGCRWTWVVTDPSPSGDKPDSKYKRIDVLVGTSGSIVEIAPKYIHCEKQNSKSSARRVGDHGRVTAVEVM